MQEKPEIYPQEPASFIKQPILSASNHPLTPQQVKRFNEEAKKPEHVINLLGKFDTAEESATASDNNNKNKKNKNNKNQKKNNKNKNNKNKNQNKEDRETINLASSDDNDVDVPEIDNIDNNNAGDDVSMADKDKDGNDDNGGDDVSMTDNEKNTKSTKNKERISVAKSKTHNFKAIHGLANTKKVEEMIKGIYSIYPNSKYGQFTIICEFMKSCM